MPHESIVTRTFDKLSGSHGRASLYLASQTPLMRVTLARRPQLVKADEMLAFAIETNTATDPTWRVWGAGLVVWHPFAAGHGETPVLELPHAAWCVVAAVPGLSDLFATLAEDDAPLDPGQVVAEMAALGFEDRSAELAVVKARWYPDGPPSLPWETSAEWTDRVTGCLGADLVPYDHRRRRECSIGFHESCSQGDAPPPDDPDQGCHCPHHTQAGA